jgi:hypothetical protein
MEKFSITTPDDGVVVCTFLLVRRCDPLGNL